MAEQIIIPGIGDIIAEKYLIKTELGRGAYGVVFGCEQVDIGRYLAVKTLLPQAFLQGEIVKRFHREAQLISRLDHPNVIRLFDYGVHDGLLYMAVEFVSGETLASLIEKSAPIAPEVVIEISLQILAGLEHAHENGIIHRDLKPENVIVIKKDTGFEAKILDFGISKLTRGDEDEKSAMNTLTQDGTVLGTPHYMSPENIVGDPCDHRADIYALGVMMYEMVSAEHPFDAASPSAVFIKHLTSEVPLLEPEIQNTTLGSTIFHALEKQPEDRIQTAAEMTELLLSEVYVPRKTASQQEHSKKRNIILAGLFFGGTIALLIFTAAYFSRNSEDPIEVVKKEPVAEKTTPQADDDEFVFDETFEPLPAPELLEALVVAKTLRRQATSRAFSKYEDASQKAKSKSALTTTKGDKKREKITKETPKQTIVRFTSSPSGADVKINNVVIGKTPLTKSYSDPSRSIGVTISRPGYNKKSVRFTPEKRNKIHVKLELGLLVK